MQYARRNLATAVCYHSNHGYQTTPVALCPLWLARLLGYFRVLPNSLDRQYVSVINSVIVISGYTSSRLSWLERLMRMVMIGDISQNRCLSVCVKVGYTSSSVECALFSPRDNTVTTIASLLLHVIHGLSIFWWRITPHSSISILLKDGGLYLTRHLT